ncbi:hypothetical protein ABFT80_23555 [Mesorhizobium sp. SB112]|uniref:hypothetical protein n=1 Tax=Mesorhizobium sp. SB112 TaxID=3151853 RepID=UPI003264B257
MNSSVYFSKSERSRASRFDILLVFLTGSAVFAVMFLVVIVELIGGIDHWNLVRDPNAIAGNPNYFGIISNLGIVLWIGTATGAFQAYLALGPNRSGNVGSLLFYGAMFATIMGLDDFLMLHESVAGATGLPESIILTPHALLGALMCYHSVMLRTQTPFAALIAVICAFGLSFAFDLYPVYFKGQVFLEESFKLLGISMLAAYLVVVGQDAMRKRVSEIV